jgi:ArsR family transcriptional regulator
MMRYAFKARFFKMLAHPLRIQILDALRQGPTSVGDLQRALDAEQSTLSQHLAALRGQNLVQTERQGTTIRYRVTDPAIWRLLDSAREIFEHQLVDVRDLLEDLRRETTSP